MYVDDFPGPLINIKINNLTKVQETEFPAGVLEGQSPSILIFACCSFFSSLPATKREKRPWGH
jgi:hypothetical protein